MQSQPGSGLFGLTTFIAATQYAI